MHVAPGQHSAGLKFFTLGTNTCHFDCFLLGELVVYAHAGVSYWATTASGLLRRLSVRESRLVEVVFACKHLLPNRRQPNRYRDAALALRTSSHYLTRAEANTAAQAGMDVASHVNFYFRGATAPRRVQYECRTTRLGGPTTPGCPCTKWPSAGLVKRRSRLFVRAVMAATFGGAQRTARTLTDAVHLGLVSGSSCDRRCARDRSSSCKARTRTELTRIVTSEVFVAEFVGDTNRLDFDPYNPEAHARVTLGRTTYNLVAFCMFDPATRHYVLHYKDALTGQWMRYDNAARGQQVEYLVSSIQYPQQTMKLAWFTLPGEPAPGGFPEPGARFVITPRPSILAHLSGMKGVCPDPALP